jgi:nicotinate-nucleotide adenylyltransferase
MHPLAPAQHPASRRAIFGGTFDPPHRGHMAIARAAADAFHLDQVLFAPTGRQPLKLKSNPSSFADRLAMVAAACADACRADHIEAPSPRPAENRFAVTELDAPRAGGLPNYTVDTLTALRARYPDDTLFSLAGADSFLNLHHWREPQRLLELAEWIVVTRPGYLLTDDHLAPLQLTAAQRDRVHILTGVHEDVSATGLRERLRHGDPCADLLSPSVAHYIRKRALYLPHEPPSGHASLS